jgi:hypothetical protein
MLKKLLASALAIATVATCAYVPTALASAATTTTVTATKADYDGYKLLNPDGPTAETQTTVKLSFIVDSTPVNGLVETEKFDKTKASADYIKENLADLVKDAVGDIPAGKLDGTTYTTASNILTRAKVAAVYDTGAQYLVLVTTEEQIEVSIDENATYVASEDAETLAKANVSVLGWYPTGTSTTSADTLKTAAANAGLVTKIASKAFDSWIVGTGIVTAHYADVDGNADKYHPTGYTAVTYARAQYDGVVISKTNMLTGGYLGTATFSAHATVVYVPNDDSANWITYLENYLTLTTAAKTNVLRDIRNYATDEDQAKGSSAYSQYEAAGLKLVKKDSTQYAVVYYNEKGEEAKDDAETITYTLTFKGDLSSNVSSALTAGSLTADVKTTNFTTDAEEIYSILKKAEVAGATKDTLAEFVAQDSTDALVYYVEDVDVSSVLKNTPAVDKSLGYVTVTVTVDKKTATDVYYYDADGVISKANVLLSDAALEKVTKKTVTAAELGIEGTVTIGGVEAKYKSAAIKNAAVEVTYELGEATVDINDFTTTTGLFNDKAYYNRAVRAGDDVRLNVALTDKGVAKGLDISKISVEYSTVNAVKNGETYQKKETTNSIGVVLKAGQSTHFTLTAGTNIIVATVSYNNVVIGTFEPFYTYVG